MSFFAHLLLIFILACPALGGNKVEILHLEHADSHSTEPV